MYDKLGGASAGNQSGGSGIDGTCTPEAVEGDSGVAVEVINCVDGWAAGITADCGDQCEHVEVFEAVNGRWVSKGGFASYCPDALVESGMPITVARQLVPSVLCEDGPSTTFAQLERGDEGPAVAGLQQALVAAGYDVDIDSRFGPGTEAAVVAFQLEAGLQPDCIAGPATLRALDLIP